MATATDLSLPTVSEAARAIPGLKPLVAAVVVLFALFNLLELAVAFVGHTMPAAHFVAVPIAVGLMVIIWFAELGGVRWTRLAFAILVTIPNLWLAAIGHGTLNYLFMVPAVAWVAYRGSRTAGQVALALNLAVVGVGALVSSVQGPLALGPWIAWATGLIVVWWLAQVLVVQQRLAAELSALLEVSHNVASTLELQPLLALILDQLKVVVEYTGAAIWQLTPEGDALTNLDYRGPLARDEIRRLRFPLGHAGPDYTVIHSREPVIVDDIQGNSGLARAYRAANGHAGDHSFDYVRSWMGVPLMRKEQVIGMLVVVSAEPDRYTAHDAELALAIAHQAAIAIENARLYEQAQHTAQIEERQRLARELHDAVTQTLFASSLIADVLPRLWERDQAEGRRRLAELRELTRGALAEMRTLLYELRPSALTAVPLGDLLRQLVDATIGHARLPVSLSVEGQRALPPDVQVALYRLAQEALNNVAKHARASRAEVSLVYQADSVELCLRDDGQGFDLSQIPPGHLGVGIMRERALAVGAGLDIASQPGHGTRVRVTWPDRGRGGKDD